MTEAKFQRRAGVRLQYLLRQLIEEGWTNQTEVAKKAHCHQTLISKWWWRGSLSYDLLQNDVQAQTMQGFVDGFGIQGNYFLMPKPSDYHNRIKLPNGETRPADTDEVDHREFKLVSNEEFQAMRENKRFARLENRVDGLENELRVANRQLAQLLALLAHDAKGR